MARYYNASTGAEVKDLREARKSLSYPSVTTVINAMAPHSYQYLNDKRLREALESDGDTDEKLELLGNKPVFEDGNLVHNGAENYVELGVRSTLLDCPISSKQLYDYLDGFEDVQTERYVVWSLGHTAGRLDHMGLAGKRQALSDIKTVSTLKKKPEKTWLMQLGAYRAALLEEDIRCEVGYIIQFSKKNLGVVPLEISEDEMIEGAEMFKKARELFTYFYAI